MVWVTDFTGYEKLRYEVDGELKTSERYRINTEKGMVINKTNKVLTAQANNHGYIFYMIEGKPTPYHRLLYTHVNGLITAGKIIDHIDNNRKNNKIENLQCITQKENCKKNPPGRGEKRGQQIQATDTETNISHVFATVYAASQYYDIVEASIIMCCNNIKGVTKATSKKTNHKIAFAFTDDEPTIIMDRGKAIPNNPEEMEKHRAEQKEQRLTAHRAKARERYHKKIDAASANAEVAPIA